MTAVQVDGDALIFIPEALRTEALCAAAERQTAWALTHLPDKQRTTELCKEALRQDFIVLQAAEVA
jgi:hypothetical protein